MWGTLPTIFFPVVHTCSTFNVIFMISDFPPHLLSITRLKIEINCCSNYLIRAYFYQRIYVFCWISSNSLGCMVFTKIVPVSGIFLMVKMKYFSSQPGLLLHYTALTWRHSHYISTQRQKREAMLVNRTKPTSCCLCKPIHATVVSQLLSCRLRRHKSC